MTKKLFLALLMLTMTLSHQNLVSANDASQSATPSSSIQSKLEMLKQEIASKAAEIKQAVNQKISNKAWSGVIKDKTDKIITISGLAGDRKIMIDEYVVYVAKPKTTSSLKDMTVGDFIIALGDMDDTGNLVAKKVIKTKPTTAAQPAQIWGDIKVVGSNSLRVASKSATLTVNTGAKTDFQLGSQDASFNDAKVGHHVITVGTISGDQQQAYFIYFIPQSANEQVEKASSDSAKATATSSATPKTTAKPTASSKN